MAEVTIIFVGPLRLFVGERTATAPLRSLAEARDYVESRYGPVFQARLRSRGVHAEHSLWDNCAILLNGRTLGPSDEPALRDGDRLSLVPRAAGG